MKSGTYNTPVQYVKGVGPRLSAVLASRDIRTAKDLLQFFPRDYQDRTLLTKVSELREGELATVSVKTLSSHKIPIRGKRQSILDVRCTDQTGAMSLKWFHSPPGLENRLKPGTSITVTGTVKYYMNKPEIVHPEITWSGNKTENPEEYNIGRIVPIYTEIEGLTSRQLRKIIWSAVSKFSHELTEDLPSRFLAKHGLPQHAKAVTSLHFPPKDTQIEQLKEHRTPFHARLIYEEFFKLEYLVLRQRLLMEHKHATSIERQRAAESASDLEKMLPFRLTQGQTRTVAETLDDLSKANPMNRLIQGDVGSGKTAIAFLTASAVLAEGYQAALMAPTEILAEQHFKNAVNMFKGKLHTALLTGKTPQAERIDILEELSSGKPILLIGTHALIEDPVVFKNLIYIMIDEQHRFGVEQRRTLRNKGIRQDPATGLTLHPHMLILTATPIPRTLALTAYGDLSVSTIRELPPGRLPVQTSVVHESMKPHAYEKIREELKKGFQAYFIYPLINESEAEGFSELKAAVKEAEHLAKNIFPEYKVGLLHGQLRSDEKAAIMEEFKSGRIHILVSTTVIEVGVDVPNSTVMVIEHAERFGLSQLHQLRGRVGRGGAQAYCMLFTSGHVGEISALRLDVLEKTHDGFKIAESDLEIRGPGEFLGTRQSGVLPFKLANLIRDQDWLLKARDDVIELLKEDPDLTKTVYTPLRNYYEREGVLQSERLRTS